MPRERLRAGQTEQFSNGLRYRLADCIPGFLGVVAETGAASTAPGGPKALKLFGDSVDLFIEPSHLFEVILF